MQDMQMTENSLKIGPNNSQPPLESVSIDVSLIEHMLSLTYEQRLEAHEAARQLVNDLYLAGQEYYARQLTSLA
jgi:hypothetical protein